MARRPKGVRKGSAGGRGMGTSRFGGGGVQLTGGGEEFRQGMRGGRTTHRRPRGYTRY